MAKFFRYALSTFILFITLHANGAETLSIDNILVYSKSYADILPNAQTTIQRDEAKTKIAKNIQNLLSQYNIIAILTISDVTMKNTNVATISFRLYTPLFDNVKSKANFYVSSNQKIDLPLTESQAKTIKPGQLLTLKGTASFVQQENFLVLGFDQTGIVRISYKHPVNGGGQIKFRPTGFSINTAPTPKPARTTASSSTDNKYVQPQTAALGKIKSYKPTVTSKPIDMKTYSDEQISFKCPAKWKATTFKTNNLYIVTCTGDKELFSIIYSYKKLDPVDTINAWVNKHHIPEISRQAIYTSKVAGNSASSCYYYTKVGKFVHTGCVTVFNTKPGDTVIIHKQAESKNDMISPTSALYKMEKSFKLVSTNQTK